MAQFVSPPTTDLGPRLSLADLPLRPEEVSRSSMVDFQVERGSEIPLGTQLDWKIRAMIARGALHEGDRLPSVRELAQFSGVNVNTGRAVYAGLEADGLIASEHGRGTFVTELADGLRQLDEVVSQALQGAADAGVDARDVASILFATAATSAPTDPAIPLSPLATPSATLDAASHRRVLREQIARLETELAAYAWDDVRSPAPDRPATARPIPRVVGVEELERTRSELIERLARLRDDAHRRGVARQEALGQIEAMVRDPNGHRWEIVTNEETGEPGCKSYRVVPRFGPLGAIMGWWRLKVSGGCPLCAPA